ELAARNMPLAAGLALKEMFASVAELKRTGALERPAAAERMTPELVARLEEGGLSPAVARHLRKISAEEIYRLFDDPVRDAEFHIRAEDLLADAFRVTNRELRAAEVKPELTLREENSRKSLAILGLLSDPALPGRLRMNLVE